MSLDAPESVNYAATIVQVPEPLSVVGLDNLLAVPLFGYQALTQKGIKAGDLRVLFFAETQLDTEYARENNLFREATLNQDASETGYLEPNARVKAIRLRKNQSDALLMPLESLAYTGYDVSALKPGDVFDKLNGHTICRKYIAKGKKQATQGQPKVRKQVDERLFPKHLDTEHLFRNLHYFRNARRVVVTQKLHGTSWRGGNIPVNRTKGRVERFINWLGWFTHDTEYKHVYGSRNVVKGRSENNHYYDTDLWAEYGKQLEGKIPENFIVYGELIGWVDNDTPIQKGYTYNLPPGQCELYVYRVATVNPKGVIADLSWEGVKDFCASLDLKTVPELWLGKIHSPNSDSDANLTNVYADEFLDRKLFDDGNSTALPLSDPKTVDEGICVRIEGQIPHVFKAKSPLFLLHESKALDAGVADVESAA
ncbi:RNA ligase [Mycobacterium phage Bromden]|uniref:RNA ligase n=1 Tax=Mycobacterium phage Bromden TaxID=2283252 RepID=A0A345MBM2_9CAUD|nr:RNA ligase [Mycobacterium phage Bromden]AXH67893.1 RNA ligase [Mycobacterium phage Bromden]